MVALFTSSAFAWDPPASPAPTSWIADPGHFLSNDAHARLDAKLRLINQSSANEMAALILPSLDGEDIADVGDKTAQAWGVGKKGLDNGVLVVLAINDRKSRISTGKGVEGDLPDLKTHDILNAARPYLRSKDYEGALGFIFDQSSSAIANHKADVAAGRSSAAGSSNTSCSVSTPGVDAGGLVAILVLIGGVILFAVLGNRRRQRIQVADEARAWRLRQEQAQRMSAARVAREQREREEAFNKPTPAVAVPIVPSFPPAPRPVTGTTTSSSHSTHHKKHHSHSSSSGSNDSGFGFGGGSSGGGGGGDFGGGSFGGGGSSGDW